METDSHTPYLKLMGMQVISFVIMYSVMFMNVSSLDHIYLSYTRMYMSLLMVSPMVLLMMFFMKSMYTDSKLNTLAIVLSVSIFIFSFFGLRNQWFITDAQYMKAMIPHHSSAILTSQEATLSDPEVSNLADEIIVTQIEEIAEMKRLLEE